ncbi:hypothetical protein LTR36_004829 [Oleoguttula mirabilis]|uniref:2EXR domain-containing protein n=1 Tax=Oleoguttula mirabilis TaxID=1507867 RepID=A0AAV9JH09_9PEZI|nr:hypothetical protein LTR36_004829 [Oleoguttula mirabilis]
MSEAERTYRLANVQELQVMLRNRGLAPGHDTDDLVAALLGYDFDNTLRRSPRDFAELTARRVTSASAVVHNSTARIRFFRLSAELRNYIYSLALPVEDKLANSPSHQLVAFDRKDDKYAPAHMEPALLRTCSQFRAEAHPMYYDMTIEYDSGACTPYARYAKLARWLEFMGDRIKLARAIHLRQEFEYHSDCYGMSSRGSFAYMNVYATKTACKFTACLMSCWKKDACTEEELEHQAKRRVAEVVKVLQKAMPWVMEMKPDVQITFGTDEAHISYGT